MNDEKKPYGVALSAFDDDEWSWSIERRGENGHFGSLHPLASGVEISRAEAVRKIKAALRYLKIDRSELVPLPF